MKFFLNMLAAAAALMLAASCNKDNTVAYGYEGIGTVAGSSIILDNGVQFNVTSLQTDDGYKACERVYFYCDILKETSTGYFNIRLLKWTKVLRKQAVTYSSVSDWDEIGDDAVALGQGWMSGEYLNMAVLFSAKTGSETSHYLNLVYDDVNSGTDTLRFQLRHNGKGESFPSIAYEDMTIVKAFASFPIRNYIPAELNEIPIKVTWNWYKTADGRYIAQTEEQSIKGILTR